jgi:hypothetical protein
MIEQEVQQGELTGPLVPTGTQTINASLFNEHGKGNYKQTEEHAFLAVIPTSDYEKSLPAGVVALSMADSVYGETKVFTHVGCVPVKESRSAQECLSSFYERVTIQGMIPAPVTFFNDQPVQRTIVVTAGARTMLNTSSSETLYKDAWIMVRPPIELINQLAQNNLTNAGDLAALRASNPHMCMETYSFNPITATFDEYSAILNMNELLRIEAVRIRLCRAVIHLTHWANETFSYEPGMAVLPYHNAQYQMEERAALQLSNRIKHKLDQGEKVPAGVAYNMLPCASGLVVQVLRVKIGKALSTIPPGQTGAVLLDSTRPGDVVKTLMSFKNE